MKKFFIILLAVMTVCSVAFANGAQETKAPTQPAKEIPAKPSTPIEIKVAVAQTGDGFTALTNAMNAFNASQSDYVVNLYYGGSYTEIRTIMSTSTQADRPHIFAASGNDTAVYINEADRMYIPIDEFIQAENFDDSNIVANLRTNYMRDGKWQCWPLGNTNVGQYFNTEVLKKVGINAEDLKSYEEIYEACQKIGAAGYKNFYYLRALTHIDWLNYSMTAQGIEYYDNNNGRSGTPTRCLYDEGECYEATLAFFTFLRKMIDSDYLVDTNISTSDSRISFAKQESLIQDGYSSGANAMITLINENGGFEWKYQVSPTIQAGKPSKGQSPGGGALFIADKNDYWAQQGAWEFMKYLLNDTPVVEYAMATGYTPITVSGANSAEYQNYVNTKFPSAADIIAAQNATEAGVAYAPLPITPNTPYKAICKKMLKDPNYTPEMAVAELTEEVNTALELFNLTNI